MKTGLFFLLAGTIFAGFAVGLTATDSWFLAKAGAANLPMIYLATPLVMFVYTFLATALCYYASMTVVLVVSLLGVGGVAAIVGGVLLRDPEMSNALPRVFGVKLLANVWLYAAFTQMWNFISGFIDINAGKNDFPRFNAASAAGLMLGAASVALLAQKLSLGWFYLIWAAFCVLSALLTFCIGWKVPLLSQVESPVVEDNEGQVRQFGALILSRYGVMLALSAMLILAATVFCEWLSFRQFNADAMQDARDALPLGTAVSQIENYASGTLQKVLGTLGAVCGGVVMIFNLFVFSPLVKRLGVGNTILVQPVLYASAFAALSLAEGFHSAAWAFLVFQGFFVALDANTRSFLFNALPANNRVVIRNCIEGILEPTAAALVGAFIFWGAIVPATDDAPGGQWFFGLSSEWLEHVGGRSLAPKEIAVIALVFALGSFLSSLMIRFLYPRTIAANFLAGVFAPSLPKPGASGLRALLPEGPPERAADFFLRHLPACPAPGDPLWCSLLELEGPPAVALLFAVAPRLSALGLLQAVERLEQLGPTAVPLCMSVLRREEKPMAAKLLAIQALAKISTYQLAIACAEQVGGHFQRCSLYWKWSQAAQLQELPTVRAVAEKLKDAEVQVILGLLHYTGQIPDPVLVGLALSSLDVKERADMLETLSIAVENPQRLELIVGTPGKPAGEIPTPEALAALCGDGVPEALAAAIVRDLPELSAHWGALSVVLSAERQLAGAEPGRWEKRLALAVCPQLRGAFWDAIDVMASEVGAPAGAPRGLWITADAGRQGPAGTCLNPGWLAGCQETPCGGEAPQPRILELSSEWLHRLSQLCPRLPMEWLVNVRQSGY